MPVPMKSPRGGNWYEFVELYSHALRNVPHLDMMLISFSRISITDRKSPVASWVIGSMSGECCGHRQLPGCAECELCKHRQDVDDPDMTQLHTFDSPIKQTMKGAIG